MDQSIMEFLEYIQKKKNVSENTLTAYKQDLTGFQAFLTGSTELPLATNTNVVSYLMELKTQGKSKATVNRKLASLRAYYRYLIAIGQISQDPTEGIKSPRIARKEISYLSVEEIEDLLSKPDDSIKGKRDSAILELLYATGLRVSEIIELRNGDLNRAMGFVKCNGNHGRARIVPMGKPSRKAMDIYLTESRPALLREQEDTEETPLFLNYAGKAFTRQGMWKVLKQYGDEAGLGEKLTPQTIRNSFAMHMVHNGIDMKSLQELMGHEDILATQAFFEHSRQRIKDVYDRTHPRAK